MSEKELMLTLAKVIIAAAWADGELRLVEVNSLKEMLLWSRCGRQRELDINQREWATLEMYIDAPVDAAEREQLVQQLQAALRTPKDREMAISALTDIIQADGTVTAEEQAAIDEIKATLESANLGLLGQLGRLVRSSVNNNALEREQFLADGVERDRARFAG
jgi:tellurite resistance protein